MKVELNDAHGLCGVLFLAMLEYRLASDEENIVGGIMACYHTVFHLTFSNVGFQYIESGRT